MNTSSILIVSCATLLGTSALFMTIKFGLNVSDDYASKLSVHSDEYLKLRAKAVALGEDPTKIKANAARTKKPATYNRSLAIGTSSPYVRPDSDSSLNNLISNSSSVVDAVKEGKPIVSGLGANPADNSDQAVAAEAGLSQRQLTDLIEVVKQEEKANKGRSSNQTEVTSLRTGNGSLRAGNSSLRTGSVSGSVRASSGASVSTLGSAAVSSRSTAGAANTGSTRIVIDNAIQPDVYTVHDEIRHQLATEEMSDEKRAMMESLLPKEKPKAVRAVNVILEFDTKNCLVPRNSNSLIGVMFRHESHAIRGSSLNDLDELIAMRERCDGKLLLEDHAAAASKKDIELRESRRDEVKYYLLRRRVPVESIILSSL